MRLQGLGLVALAACTTGGAARPVPAPEPAPRVEPEVTPEPAAPPTPPATPRDPPRVLTDPGSGITVAWAGAATAAVVTQGNLVVLEPDGEHMGAIGWRDGEPRWRIELPVRAGARLHGLDDRVVVHDFDRALVVEGARGRVLGQHPAPIDGRPPYSHTMEHRRDACAWVGPCGIQAFDCDNGAPRGQYFESTEIRLSIDSDDPSEHDTQCSPEPSLLGRHLDTIAIIANVPRTDETGRPAGSMPSLIGLDATTGERQWAQPMPADEPSAGMTDDGACWVLDADAPQLHLHECDTGQLRWTRPLGVGRLEAHAMGELMVVARHHGGRWRLSAYSTATGNVAWGLRLPRRQIPLLADAPIRHAHATGNRRIYALIDPARGAITGRVLAGRDEEIWRDPAGGFVLIGRDLREVDDEGRLTRQLPFTALRAHTVTAGHILTHDGEAIEVFDREQLRERARIEGRLSIEPAPLAPDRLLLHRRGEDAVALVLGLEAPGRSGRR
ncbi:MAG: PQQ-like beta-propeller repeat protein [Deltaproteobacteria bacterium]|nr:PQQ-like beta-propeller repeat protein [Deltaproteobacteria bacterium]